MDNSLKLVVLFNATHTQYCILAHNESPEVAQEVVKGNAERGVPMILDQGKAHRAENIESCRACRETVLRQATTTPKPKFSKNFKKTATPAPSK